MLVGRLAGWCYERAGFVEESPPGPAAILRTLVGDENIRFSSGPLDVQHERTGFRVRIPEPLEREELCLVCALAAARVAALSLQIAADEADLEEAALAIIMPGPAVRRVIDAYGPRAEMVAGTFVVAPEVAVRRLRALGVRPGSGIYVRPNGRLHAV